MQHIEQTVQSLVATNVKRYHYNNKTTALKVAAKIAKYLLLDIYLPLAIK